MRVNRVALRGARLVGAFIIWVAPIILLGTLGKLFKADLSTTALVVWIFWTIFLHWYSGRKPAASEKPLIQRADDYSKEKVNNQHPLADVMIEEIFTAEGKCPKCAGEIEIWKNPDPESKIRIASCKKCGKSYTNVVPTHGGFAVLPEGMHEFRDIVW